MANIKKITVAALMIFAVLAIFSGSLYAAEWVLIMKDDGLVFYYDDESVETNSKGIASAWGKTTKEDGSSDNMKDMIEINCNTKEYRIIATVPIDKDIENSRNQTDWIAIEDTSPCNRLMALICSPKEKPPKF